MTLPTGYREFGKNNAEEAMRASGITNWETLVAKSANGGVYEGRWRYVEIWNASDIKDDTFTGLDCVTGAEITYDSLLPLKDLIPDGYIKGGLFTKIKIPEGSTLVIVAYKN